MSLAGSKRNKVVTNILEAKKNINVTNNSNEVMFNIDNGTNKLTSNVLLNEFKNDVKIDGNLSMRGEISLSDAKLSGDVYFSDNLICLNEGVNDYKYDNLDIGFSGRYWDASSGSYKYSGLYREADIKSFVLFNGITTHPNPNIPYSEITSSTLGNLNVNTLYALKINDTDFNTLKSSVDTLNNRVNQSLTTTSTPSFVALTLDAGINTNSIHTNIITSNSNSISLNKPIISSSDITCNNLTASNIIGNINVTGLNADITSNVSVINELEAPKILSTQITSNNLTINNNLTLGQSISVYNINEHKSAMTDQNIGVYSVAPAYNYSGRLLCSDNGNYIYTQYDAFGWSNLTYQNYRSAYNGSSWDPLSFSSNLSNCIIVSSTGQYVFAYGNDFKFYMSSDYGLTFPTMVFDVTKLYSMTTVNTFIFGCISQNNKYVIVGIRDKGIFYSNNYGLLNSWKQASINSTTVVGSTVGIKSDCDISATGKYAVINDAGGLWISQDYCNTWTFKANTTWANDASKAHQTAMSRDGKYMFAMKEGSASILRSSDYGNTFTMVNNSVLFQGMDCDSSGKYVVFLLFIPTGTSSSNNIYYSNDYLQTISILGSTNKGWATDITMSKDCRYLFCCCYNANPWFLRSVATTLINENITTASLTVGSNNITLPSSSGQLALKSDIPSGVLIINYNYGLFGTENILVLNSGTTILGIPSVEPKIGWTCRVIKYTNSSLTIYRQNETALMNNASDNIIVGSSQKNVIVTYLGNWNFDVSILG